MYLLYWLCWFLFLASNVKSTWSPQTFTNHVASSSYHLLPVNVLKRVLNTSCTNCIKQFHFLLHRKTISCPHPSTENSLQHQRTPKGQIQNHFLIITGLDFSGEFDTIDYSFLETHFVWFSLPGKTSSLPSSSVLL